MLISKDKLNLLSLISIQASNAVLPLVLFPFLLTTTGPELFSKLVVAETISIIILTIIIYGYEIDGVKRAAALFQQKDRQQLSHVFSEIFFSRLMLFCCALLLLPALYLLYDSETFFFIISWLLIPLSYLLQNSYFFLAIQDNFVLAIINVLSRAAALTLTLLYIKDNVSGMYAPLLIGICHIVGAGLTLTYLLKFFKIKLSLNISDSFESLSRNFHIFLSNASVLLYKDVNVLLLSLVVNDPSVISSYSLAEKFTKSLQAICRPISQFFFAKVIIDLQLFKSPNEGALKLILKSTYPQLGIVTAALMSLLLATVTDKALPTNPIENHATVMSLFFFMSLSIYFGLPNFMLGSIGLNVLGKKAYFSAVVVIVGITNLFVCLVLSIFMSAWGAAVSFVFAEFMLLTFVSLTYMKGFK